MSLPCAASKCGKELQACNKDTTCAAFIKCSGACKQDPKCIADCHAMSDDAAVTTVINCVNGNCSDVCPKVDPGTGGGGGGAPG